MIERLEYTLTPPPSCPTNQDHLRLRKAPDNPYFRKTPRREKQRTILVAVKTPFPPQQDLNLVPVAEPDRTRPDLWVRRRHQVLRRIRSLFHRRGR